MTSPRDDRGRLPGGISVGRARWLLAPVGRWAWLIGPPLVVVVAAAWTRQWAVVAAVLVLAVVVRLWPAPAPGIEVDVTRQPDLYVLVTAVARELGRRAPARIWLTGGTDVTGFFQGRRAELRIGLPVLRCLPAVELRALVAHELALLDQPRARLVVPLHRRWVDRLLDRPYGAPVAPVGSAELGPLGSTVDARADAAVSTLIDGPTAARAAAVAVMVPTAYTCFVLESGRPVRPWPGHTFVVDLDDGWRRALAHGDIDGDWDPVEDPSRLVEQHPGLIGELGGMDTALTLATDSVAVAELSLVDNRRLSRRAPLIRLVALPRWRRYADTPASWWRDRAAVDVERGRAGATAVLGRAPVDDAELAEVLATRVRELAATAQGTTVAELFPAAPAVDPAPLPPPAALVALIECHLMDGGWRLEHPAVRGVLLAPDGVHLDVTTMAATEVAAMVRAARSG